MFGVFGAAVGCWRAGTGAEQLQVRRLRELAVRMHQL